MLGELGEKGEGRAEGPVAASAGARRAITVRLAKQQTVAQQERALAAHMCAALARTAWRRGGSGERDREARLLRRRAGALLREPARRTKPRRYIDGLPRNNYDCYACIGARVRGGAARRVRAAPAAAAAALVAHLPAERIQHHRWE